MRWFPGAQRPAPPSVIVGSDQLPAERVGMCVPATDRSRTVLGLLEPVLFTWLPSWGPVPRSFPCGAGPGAESSSHRVPVFRSAGVRRARPWRASDHLEVIVRERERERQCPSERQHCWCAAPCRLPACPPGSPVCAQTRRASPGRAAAPRP